MGNDLSEDAQSIYIQIKLQEAEEASNLVFHPYLPLRQTTLATICKQPSHLDMVQIDELHNERIIWCH